MCFRRYNISQVKSMQNVEMNQSIAKQQKRCRSWYFVLTTVVMSSPRPSCAIWRPRSSHPAHGRHVHQNCNFYNRTYVATRKEFNLTSFNYFPWILSTRPQRPLAPSLTINHQPLSDVPTFSLTWGLYICSSWKPKGERSCVHLRYWSSAKFILEFWISFSCFFSIQLPVSNSFHH